MEASAPRVNVARDQRRASTRFAQPVLDAEADLLGFYAFPREHWSKLRSNPLERVNREIGCRTDIVDSLANDVR